MDEFTISRKFEVIGNVAVTLSYRRRPERAVEFRKLCDLAEVTEEEARNAIKFLMSKGMKIRLADGLPHKIYWERNEKE